MNGLLGNIYGLEMIESQFATTEETTEEVITRSWYERFFDPDPTRPLWQKTRTIQKHVMKPTIYKINNRLIYHPIFKEELYRVMNLGS